MYRFGKDPFLCATCNVILDSGKSSYNPGDELKGNVVINTPRNLMFTACKVALEGTILVKFKEKKIFEHKVETFLSKFKLVAGDAKTKMLLTPPERNFPFSLELPSATILPGSFNSPYGIILYQVVAYLNSGKMWYKKGETKFIVNPVLEIPKEMNPLTFEKSTTGKTCAKLKFKFQCDHGSVHYAGDRISFRLQVEKQDQISIKAMSLALIKKMSFKAGSGKIAKQVLVVAMPNFINLDWSGNLQIPFETKPSQSGHLIEIEYFLKVLVIPEASTGSNLLKGDIPIKICTLKPLEMQSNLVPANARKSGLDHAISMMVMTELTDDDDTRSVWSLPPTYSCLNLRRSTSSETLPPAYEDVWDATDILWTTD